MRVVILFVFINLTQYVRSEGLIEVFGWKQMDYYNRGNGISRNRDSPAKSDSLTMRPTNKGNIVFPSDDDYGKRRNKRGTSRDDPVITESRWGGSGTNANRNTNSSSYIAYNNVPMGVTHFNGRLFITMPRRRIGIPSTLNYIDLRKDGQNPSPKLYAYPNFEVNQLEQSNPNRIVSVYRTSVDACHRLWFVDTGMLEYPGNRMQIKRPTIYAIDLSTDRIIEQFEIPQNIVDTGRGLASITIDVEKTNCEKLFAYIPDLVNSQLYVYSLENKRIWAFSHNYFNFDPLGGDLNIGGQTFRWDDGIFSTTLGPYEADGSRPVFFHAMASTAEFFVSNKVLQNENLSDRSDHGNDFRLLGNRGNRRQSTMHEYDSKTETIFYDEIHTSSVGCWNTKKSFSSENHGRVAQDEERMIYPSDLTIDNSGTMWVMTNSMPIFIYSNLDPNVVNFRVWKQNVHEAVKNTVCE